MLQCKANYGDLSEGFVLLGSTSGRIGLTTFRCLHTDVRYTNLTANAAAGWWWDSGSSHRLLVVLLTHVS